MSAAGYLFRTVLLLSQNVGAGEAAVVGRPINEATADLAGRLAVEGAVPLQHNGYKIPLMRNLVNRAIRGAEPWTP